ncbi:hypothetical protein KJE20_09770 [Pyrenophora tritici-repentis]|nr:hypothetical protein Ptr86124_010040 [Pyrenophora tritici-repentis]KAI1680919.1 hypothetical protein KJE20_09770 [Pyrenophora tritici-repentis]
MTVYILLNNWVLDPIEGQWNVLAHIVQLLGRDCTGTVTLQFLAPCHKVDHYRAAFVAAWSPDYIAPARWSVDVVQEAFHQKDDKSKFGRTVYRLRKLEALALEKTVQAARIEAQSAVMVVQAEAQRAEAARIRADAARTVEEAVNICLQYAKQNLESWASQQKRT